MAEIKIEKKKPIWPWIILVLVILALLYFFVFANDDDVNDDMDDTTEQVGDAWDEDSTDWDNDNTTNWDNDSLSTTGVGVAGYMAYIGNKEKMGVDHEYTNNALIKLIDAVEAKAKEVNYDITADLQAARKDAEKITNDPSALNHANTIKDAGNKIAMALSKIQKDKFPDLSSEVEDVKKAVENIKADTQTLNQKDQINKFYDEAGDALEKMS